MKTDFALTFRGRFDEYDCAVHVSPPERFEFSGFVTIPVCRYLGPMPPR